MSLSPEEEFEQNILSEPMAERNSVYKKNIAKVPRKYIKCEVLLKHRGRLNQKIITYFSKNLRNLNAEGIKFDWIAVYDEELDFYEEQDIHRFPTLIVNDNKVDGLSNIFKFLSSIMNNGAGIINTYFNRNGKSEQRNNQDERRDDQQNNVVSTREELKYYMAAELNKGKTSSGGFQDDESDDEDKIDFSKKSAEMIKSRQSAGMAIASSSTVNPEVQEKNNYKKNNSKKNVTWKDSNTHNDSLTKNAMNVINESRGNGADADDELTQKYWADKVGLDVLGDY